MPYSAFARLTLAIGLLGTALLAQEPSDLTLELRPASGSNRFQIGEIIPLEAAFSSTTPNRYLEPCAPFWESHFGFPQCRFFNHSIFTITPEDGWVDLTTEPNGGSLETLGGPTIPIPSADLTSKPKVFPYALTHRFRFKKPGNYRVQLRMEVGLDDETTQAGQAVTPPAKPHFVIVSGSMELEIIPASAEWQRKVIREGVDAYSHPTPPRLASPSAEYLQYEQATDALCNLGTPDATRALVDLLSEQHQEIRLCLFHTPSMEAALDELKRLISDPDAIVNAIQFSEFPFLLSKLSAMKVGTWPSVEEESKQLISSLPQKHGKAQTESLLTALHYPVQVKDSPFQQPHDVPFPETVVALVVSNYDPFPWDSQQWILHDAWPNVRSLLMLPLVRRLADAGNGQALLRWMELDPNAATEFMRKEALRPAPRFSSFYLRLPDAELTEQEQTQIASNFVALTDSKALFNGATLLHRYATKAVLPIVLPYIDSKSSEWSDSVLFPALAYVLKVSPEEAAPRLESLLKKTNQEPWQGTFFTDIGFLEPGPVLQRLAFQQIDAGHEPLAADAIKYLKLHGPVSAKPMLWKQLELWQAREAAITAERDKKRDAPAEEIAELNRRVIEQGRMVTDLTSALAGAQAWIFTPQDADRLQSLLKEPDRRTTTFGPGAGSYAIYINRRRQLTSPSQVPEYMLAAERLQYMINQYECRDMRTLKEKLLQFPAGSTFFFTWEFTAADQAEIVEIAHFLQSHGYKLSNPQQWSFLPVDASQ